MNKKILESWMSREPETDKERYIFLSDNRKICDAIVTVDFRSIYIAPKSSTFFDLEEFKAFLSDHLYGCNMDMFSFVPCCLRKKTNDEIANFCKANEIDVKTSGWSIFREKEYLEKYEYQDELEKILGSYIKRFEGDGIVTEDLRPFHTFNAAGTPCGVIDVKIVEYIMEVMTLFVMDQESYIYERGVYKRDKDGIRIMSMIQSLIYPKLIRATTIERVYRLLIIQPELQKTMSEINTYPAHWINFKNGMLDVRSARMKKHSPNYYAINQIPHIYDPNAVPENSKDTTIMKFLSMSVPDGQDQTMLLEYIGYCMTRDTCFQKMLMITGEGGTGKSQIISLIQHIVGEENCSPVSLQDLSKRFYPSELFGKLLNACPDNKGGTMDDVSNLKKATGEDLLMAERKNRDPFAFRSYAKLLFSANKIPLNLDEKSNAFYRRLLILQMNRVLKEEEKDRELLQKLKNETQYVICLAVYALKKLYEDGKFIESEGSRMQVQKLYQAADSVKAFLDERMEPDPGSRILKTAAFQLYEEYCKDYGRQSHGRNQFYSSMEEKGYASRKIGGERFFLGIKEKGEDFEQCEENPFAKQ